MAEASALGGRDPDRRHPLGPVRRVALEAHERHVGLAGVLLEPWGRESTAMGQRDGHPCVPRDLTKQAVLGGAL